MVGVRIKTGVDVVELAPHHDDRGRFEGGAPATELAQNKLCNSMLSTASSGVVLIEHHYEVVAPRSISPYIVFPGVISTN
jgi:hypothetical protein